MRHAAWRAVVTGVCRPTIQDPMPVSAGPAGTKGVGTPNTTIAHTDPRGGTVSTANSETTLTVASVTSALLGPKSEACAARNAVMSGRYAFCALPPVSRMTIRLSGRPASGHACHGLSALTGARPLRRVDGGRKIGALTAATGAGPGAWASLRRCT